MERVIVYTSTVRTKRNPPPTLGITPWEGGGIFFYGLYGLRCTTLRAASVRAARRVLRWLSSEMAFFSTSLIARSIRFASGSLAILATALVVGTIESVLRWISVHCLHLQSWASYLQGKGNRSRISCPNPSTHRLSEHETTSAVSNCGGAAFALGTTLAPLLVRKRLP